MRKSTTYSFILTFGLAASCAAQQYEIGGMASYGFTKNLGLSGPAGSAVTGFQPGGAFGAVVGNNLYPWLSGELRYSYLQNNLKVSSGGNEATFSGVGHAVHYDILLHPPRLRGSRMQPFIAGGGGLKVFEGTGKETAYQPLNNFALLTKTRQLEPLISVGGGAKFALSPRVVLRTEFRDYITPFPRQVIAPAPSVKVSGWIHNFVPMVGISFLF